MYANLATAAPGIQESQISQFYKDATFFIDVLRHAGEADVAGFAGGSNVSMDEAVWASEPYTPQDLMNQVNWGRTQSPYGQQIYADSTNFVDGINAYIVKAQNPLFTATMMPGEYAALGMPQGPQPFTLEDMVSIATLVGGIFGNGGGDQLSNAILYEDLERRFGPERVTVAGSPELVKPRPARRRKRAKPRHSNDASPARAQAKRKRRHTRPASAGDHSGFATFLSFVDPSDPEPPTTVRGASFPYQTLPRRSRAVQRTIALPDRGSVQFVNHVVGGAAPPGASDSASAARAGTGAKDRIGAGLGAGANAGPGLLSFPRGMSNALLISAAHSKSGHPLAVMGPQVSYFTLEILMEEDIHGPGIDADGAAFPGVNLYVELGARRSKHH